MKEFNVQVCANIVRKTFKVTAENEEEAAEIGRKMFDETKIEDMTRVDVSDVDVF